MGIDHDLLRAGKNAEELQVVRYDRSQEYAPHHDFGDDGTPEPVGKSNTTRFDDDSSTGVERGPAAPVSSKNERNRSRFGRDLNT